VRDASIDYDRHAPEYPRHRQADPRIAARVHAALGDARTVLNVGAGCGSYEPEDRYVLAVEPSTGMRAQRPPHLAPTIIASAEALPLDEDAFDAAMAISTLHHWRDPAAGLRELRRVARGPVVVLTVDTDVLAGYWMMSDYLPEALADDRERFPTIDAVADILGGARVEPGRLRGRFPRGPLRPAGSLPGPRPAGRSVRLAASARGRRAARPRGAVSRPRFGHVGRAPRASARPARL
jgi:SAM-dependent methyltransferase